LNACLGTEFTDGQLYFGGIRCASHISTTAPKDDEEIYLEHEVGTACLHLGNHRHKAMPITSGRRLNLILWVGDDYNRLKYIKNIFLVSIVKFR
jgi:hypothetical protein